jgi:hypothetical protein
MVELLAVKVGPFHVAPLDATIFAVLTLILLCFLGLGIVALRVLLRYFRTGRF